MNIETCLKRLSKRGACGEAVDWVAKSGHKTAQEVWDKCERGDWMLWLLGKLSGPPQSKGRKQLVRATCGCARLALNFIKSEKSKKDCLNCIEVTESWADGKATIEEVKEARKTDAATAYAADAADAAYAAAAAYAADAADAANAAAYAAEAAAYAAARNKILKDCADVVRKFYPKAPMI